MFALPVFPYRSLTLHVGGFMACAVTRAACCSYLALVAALASEADQVFIPEDPVPNNWVEKLCKRLAQVRKLS